MCLLSPLPSVVQMINRCSSPSNADTLLLRQWSKSNSSGKNEGARVAPGALPPPNSLSPPPQEHPGERKKKERAPAANANTPPHASHICAFLSGAMSSRRATFLPSFLLLHRMNELERGVRDCLYIMWNQQQQQQHTGQTEQQWQRGEDNNNALMQCTAHIANNNEQMPILFESRRLRVVRERVQSQRTHSAGISTQCSLSHTSSPGSRDQHQQQSW